MNSVAAKFAFALCLGGSVLAAGSAGAGPVNNGGPEITGTPDVFYIWYGNWAGNSALGELPGFLKNINGSAYLGTDTTMGANGQVTYGGSATINTMTNKSLYLGASLNGTNPNASMLTIVNSVLSHGLLPNVPNAIYDVLTAPGISVSGFNTQFCGWHYSTDWGGSTLGIQYGFIGDPTAAQTGCYAQSKSPNYNLGADAMVSIIAHELIETVTDPTGTAWWDSNPASATGGNESADMCAWNFGKVTKTFNGSYANLKAGGINYLVQTQWVNTGGLSGGTGACAMSTSGPFYAPLATASSNSALPPQNAPEPATLACFGAGTLGLFFSRRRRTNAQTRE
jgi:hypothetical protein